MALNYAGGRIFATINAMEKQICEHFGIDNLPDEIYEAFVDSIFVGYSWYAERSLTETLRARFRLGNIPDQSVSADSFQGSGTGGNRTF